VVGAATSAPPRAPSARAEPGMTRVRAAPRPATVRAHTRPGGCCVSTSEPATPSSRTTATITAAARTASRTSRDLPSETRSGRSTVRPQPCDSPDMTSRSSASQSPAHGLTTPHAADVCEAVECLKYLQMGQFQSGRKVVGPSLDRRAPPVPQADHGAEAEPAVQLGRRGFEHQRYPNRARSSRLRTLPDAVRGRPSTNAIARGSL